MYGSTLFCQQHSIIEAVSLGASQSQWLDLLA